MFFEKSAYGFNLASDFEKVEVDEDGDCWGQTLRVRTRIDVKKPLGSGVFVKLGAMSDERWIPITYEKLLDFCYGCGMLGHVLKDCEAGLESGEEELQFGPWLRASPHPRTNSRDNRGGSDARRGRGCSSDLQRSWGPDDQSANDLSNQKLEDVEVTTPDSTGVSKSPTPKMNKEKEDTVGKSETIMVNVANKENIYEEIMRDKEDKMSKSSREGILEKPDSCTPFKLVGNEISTTIGAGELNLSQGENPKFGQESKQGGNEDQSLPLTTNPVGEGGQKQTEIVTVGSTWKKRDRDADKFFTTNFSTRQSFIPSAGTKHTHEDEGEVQERKRSRSMVNQTFVELSVEAAGHPRLLQ